MYSGDPPPGRVSETILRLDADANAPFNAYWLKVAGDRSEYAAELQPLLQSHSMGVLIVRNNGFTNANALMLDLLELLEQNRAAFLEVVAHQPVDSGRIGIVLLARAELGMGQAYSPVTWPEWVPRVGNREVTCFITDVTRRIAVPLDAEEVDGARVHNALFAVEEALVRRLIEVHGWTQSDQQSFFHRVRRPSDAGWSGFLAECKKGAASVRNPRSYRPDRRRGKSVVSRLWELSVETPPGRLSALQPELAAALGITNEQQLPDSSQALLAVLTRRPEDSNGRIDCFCRNLISTVSTACQFITCCAHAHEYPQFPINLLSAFVDDLYSSLATLESSIIQLSDDHTIFDVGESP